MKITRLTLIPLFILASFCIQPVVLMAQRSSWSSDQEG